MDKTQDELRAAARSLREHLEPITHCWFFIGCGKNDLVVYYDENAFYTAPKAPLEWKGFQVRKWPTSQPTIGGAAL